jgi:glycosyltransferase involved in cell wall biosynthesis
MSQQEREVALIVTPRFPPLLGGMERECALLASQFGQMGYRVVVLTEDLGQGLPERDEAGGALVIRIPSSPQRSTAVQLRVALRMARVMVSLRGQARFAIVRTFTLPALVSGLLRRLRLIDYPTLVTAETGGQEDDIVALEDRPGAEAMKWLVTGNDLLNGLCQANIDHLGEFGYPAGRVTMIPNGIETGAWQSTLPPARIERFLFLGRLEESKGIFELVEALTLLRDQGRSPRLLVAGAGPDEAEMKRRVADAGLEDAVEFAGLVPHEEIDRLFEQADCLVLPSWSEGMPLSVLEAATRHRALVLSDVGDMGRLFGGSARIFPPRDVEALASCLAEAMDDPQPAADYDAVISEVSIETVAERLARELAGA